MKRLKINYRFLKLIINTIFILLLSKSLYSNEISFEIVGNDFTDTEAILSILNSIPDNIDKESSNEIIKVLNESNLFSEVSVKLVENKYIITVFEYPIINDLFFSNNERLKDEDLELIASNLGLTTFNSESIDLFISEVLKVYQSFGYNNVTIDYTKNINKQKNTVDLYFDISDGKITKINKIIISGNVSFPAQDIKDIINWALPN